MNYRNFLLAIGLAAHASAQSIALPWSGHGHDPQHSGISRFPAQSLEQVRWQMPVDLDRTYWGTRLLIHYGSAVVTRANTVIVPVKTGADDGFRLEARAAADGAVRWILPTDYSLPPHSWVPACGIALTPKGRLFFPAAGGTVRFRDDPDAASGATGQIAFYGAAQYAAAPATFNSNVKISTPITTDRYGNLFFGFVVLGPNPANLQSGLARIGEDGVATWISAATAAADSNITRVLMNCAPALSHDQKTLYLAVTTAGDYGSGYLVAFDSRTLAPLHRVLLKDARDPTRNAILPVDGSSSPTVGPDGDVYFGVLEQPFYSNNLRGWLLHFDSSLGETRTPGAFGWDDTATIVPASSVPGYAGASSYLVMTKSNNYVSGGGDGVNRLALLDPQATMTDPVTGIAVMQEILTVAGPTPDWEYPNVPGAVREWCVNAAAYDPVTSSVFAANEDGKLYRWDLASNTLAQVLTLTDGIGEAYTPTVIGVDGTVYAVANGLLFAAGTAASP